MPTLYRLLLLAYPAELRLEYGAEMSAAVDDAWREAARHGAAARMRLTAQLLSDFVRSLPGAWRARAPRPPHWKRDAMLSTLIREIRLAFRVLWLSRGSSAATVLTLALTIGAATTVFSVVHAVVLKPLPYKEPGRLVRLWENNIVRHQPRNVVAPANFMEWRDRAASFESMAAFADDTVSLTGDGPAEQLDMRYVSWNMFDTLGIKPAVGRAFLQSESVQNYPRKVMLSWRVWQRRYNGDPTVVGRSLRFDGVPMEVVGILPAGFRLLGDDVDVFWQLREGPSTRIPTGRQWFLLGRLKPGVSMESARAELTQINELLERQWPAFNTGWRSTLLPIGDDLSGDARTPLLLLFGAVGIVLIAGCANTTNILLARASARSREMALRTALGATRWQLVRQLLTEGFVLAAVGAVSGLAVANVSLLVIRAFGPSLGIPRLDESTLDSAVLQFSLLVVVGAALLFSLAPALQALRQAPASPLASGGRWSTGRRGEQRARRVLVVAQIACAVVLVIGGALVSRSLARLVAVDPGFDPNTFTFTVSLPGSKYQTPESKARFFQSVLDDIRSSPGVEAAGGVVTLPLGGMGTATGVVRPDMAPPARGTEPVADVRSITGDYFNAMRIRLQRGRVFSANELANPTKVCVLSSAAARQLFGNEDPVGKQVFVHLNGGPDEVIGVVDDVHNTDLQQSPRAMVYYTFARVPFSSQMIYTLKSGVDDRTLTARAIAAVANLDKDVAVNNPVRMSAMVGKAVASPRAGMWVVAAFAGIALVLSLIGVGALLAAFVANRIPEFGVRLALGAAPSDIRRMVLMQGVWLVGTGLAIGIAGAAAISSLLGALLFDVLPLDPLTYASASAVIALLALIAADIPARRATKANPADALR